MNQRALAENLYFKISTNRNKHFYKRIDVV